MPNVSLTRRNSIADQLDQLHERIARRAYELFQSRDGLSGDPLSDWVTAEEELVWKPAVELRENDGTLTVAAALPGVEPRDIQVHITPQDVVITAAIEHTHAVDTGQVHCCEFRGGQVFRAVPLPKAIDVTQARAEYQNGLLNVTAPVALEASSLVNPYSAAPLHS